MPTTSSHTYTGEFDITAPGTTVIKAYACGNGYAPGSVVTKNVSVPQAAAPAADIASGSLTSAKNVTLSTNTTGAEIYYTLDGSTPTINGTKYTGPIKISETTVLKAIAVASGCAASTQSSFDYTFDRVFTMGRDNYSFVNERLSFGYPAGYRISPSVFADVLGMGRGLQVWRANSLWQGSCYGLSATAALFYDGTLKLERYTDAPNVYSLSGWEHYSDFITLIERYQVVQYNMDLIVQRTGEDGNLRFNKKSGIRDSEKNDFTGIINALKGDVSEPVVLIVSNNSGGHAVLPYRVEEIKTGEEYDVYVYDSKTPQDENCILKLYNNDFTYGNYTKLSFNTISGIKAAMGKQSGNDDFMSIVVSPKGEDIKIYDGNDNEIDYEQFRTDHTDTSIVYENFEEYALPTGNYAIKYSGESGVPFSVSVLAYGDYKSAEMTATGNNDEIDVIDYAGSKRFMLQMLSDSTTHLEVYLYNDICGGKKLETTSKKLSVTENSTDWIAQTANNATVYCNGKSLGNVISKTEAAYGDNDGEGIVIEKNSLAIYSATKKNISGDCSLYIYNYTGDLTGGKLTAGIYTKDGKMLLYTIYDEEVLLVPGENYINLGSLNYGVGTENHTIKFFLWDSYEKMSPLSDELCFEIN